VERQNVVIVSNYRGIKNFLSFYFFLFNKCTWNLLLNYINKIKYNNLKLRIYNIRADVPLAWGLYFQDGASPSFEGIVDLHNRIMFYLVVILFGVSWVMLSILWNFNKSRNKLVYRYLNHGTLIELIWTVGPALVLIAIAFPSFKLLYLMDEVIDPAMTVKVTGLFINFLNTYMSSYKYLKYGGLKLYILYMNKFNFYSRLINKISLFKINSFHTLVKAKNRIGPHNKDVISVIIGSLLGDAYGNKRFVEGTRICFRQSIIHIEYLFWLYQFFNTRGYCSSLEPRIYTRFLKKKNNIEKKYYGYEFNTYTFRSFDWIYKMFYKDGKNRIHSNLG
jgi:heme/copper-type cytochrome/quinol oxidase subunit 2